MDDYVEETKIIEKTDKEKENELVRSILKAKSELELYMKNFEYAEDDLIDYYTYQIKAVRAKLDYLMKKAKDKEIVVDMVNQVEFKLKEVI